MCCFQNDNTTYTINKHVNWCNLCFIFFCLWTLKLGTLSSINKHCYQHLGSLWISLKPVNIKEVFFLIFFRKSSLGELKDTKQYFNILLLTSIPTFLKTIKNLPWYGTPAHYSFATLGDVNNLAWCKILKLRLLFASPAFPFLIIFWHCFYICALFVVPFQTCVTHDPQARPVLLFIWALFFAFGTHFLLWSLGFSW